LVDNQKVKPLFRDGFRSWDADVVCTIFPDEVASKILQIPISRHAGEDFVSWPHTRTRFGYYTMQSGYNLARSRKFSDQQSIPKKGLSSEMERDARLWKMLWATKAPGKMKITMWRFSHHCLLSGHQLQIRHVPASTECYFCGIN
jgi:hypothetical protein